VGSRTGFTDARDEGPVAPPRGIVREYVEVILVCVIVVVFLRSFVFQQSEIPSGSMEDTLLVGDYIIVNRFLYAPTSFDWERKLLPIREPRRGDVVVFKKPQEPELDFIKRVIGLPGDSVELRRGRLYVNGQSVDEPYINGLYRTVGSFGPIEVEPGYYFLLGDHRNSSSDSRVWGPVPEHLLKGRASWILLSTNPPADSGEPPGKVTLRSLGRKLYNLVFNARWDRALRLIY
jgi:signal peptidase I